MTYRSHFFFLSAALAPGLWFRQPNLHASSSINLCIEWRCREPHVSVGLLVYFQQPHDVSVVTNGWSKIPSAKFTPCLTTFHCFPTENQAENTGRCFPRWIMRVSENLDP